MRFYDLLDQRWDSLRANLGKKFTTQKFRNLVEKDAPDIWREIVKRYGLGGRGGGKPFSPSKVLANYLERKVKTGTVESLGLTESEPGYGSHLVSLWEVVDIPPSPQDLEFVEGGKRFRTHLIRERDHRVRAEVLRERGIAGLSCDLCLTAAPAIPKEFRSSVFEVHHNTAPVAGGERKNSTKDMALLCACCHRAIHRLIAKIGWVTVGEAKRFLCQEIPF
jgi:hypothetical protein